MRTPLAITLACTVGLLAACGGDDADSAPATEVPVSAAQSPGSYVAYAQALLQSLSDTDDALSLAMVDVPPTSESDEAVDID